ncbi:MAG TPA: ribonuclease activity regulator RraA, partial [Chloroflexota bacterium]|nr:ribonuclease activity regulator RraA [Chloroflexota bacterium]
EGVVIIPRHLAAEIASEAVAQERREEFIMEKIRGGASIIGVYPPDGTTLREYDTWRASR